MLFFCSSSFFLSYSSYWMTYNYPRGYFPEYNFLTMGKNYCSHITNLMWPTSFRRRTLNEALMLMNTFSFMAYSLSLGGGYLICQTFVKHQKQYGLWPGSLKLYPILATFLISPSRSHTFVPCLMTHLGRVWSLTSGHLCPILFVWKK